LMTLMTVEEDGWHGSDSDSPSGSGSGAGPDPGEEAGEEERQS